MLKKGVESFTSIFELLWYSGNPCFDVDKFTSDRLDEKSVIKQCIWKGEAINCSQMITMTPTDNGMCCRFDLRETKDMFTDNKFTKVLEKLQKQDKLNALDTWPGITDLPNIDKKPEVGRFKGLTLILDAHSNLLSESSIEEDSSGFLLGLTKSGEFPLMGQGTKILRPGYEHFVSLSATNAVSERKLHMF